MLGKRLVVTVLILIAFNSMIGCGVTSPPTATPAGKQILDTTPAKIRYGGVTGVAMPTFIVAEEQGFFAKENLTIEKNFVSGTSPINDALAGGNLDMGLTNPIASVLASVKGAKMIMVSGFENTFIDKTGKAWESTYVVVRSGEGIQHLTDLKRKKVAVSDLGSYHNYALRAQMLASNIDPDKEMTIVPVPLQQMPGALMQKLVDAVILNADGYYQVQKLGKVDVIATHTSLVKLDIDLSAAIAVSTDFLQKSPDVIVRFLRAFIQARQWMAEDVAKNDGKSLIDLVGKSMKDSPEQVKAFYETRGGYYGKEWTFSTCWTSQPVWSVETSRFSRSMG